uniref:Putative ribonuclease H-like domain-containing protein n=1 Tax=Tanacetum cinerariifolium TaxID=118510 RepID=A0A699I3H1_TANCI|nr:putative ribonuclease H-like domain-containing protein [Tanacetum cinerariifolium]
MYCLVVTDDYSRFTWVFFLSTKDETSGVFKSFITRIENLVDHKVRVIRCDNGTEFKNREMNQFCEIKGKFDGKADEGFFVGYSLNSKAFRIFNSRTRIVEEKLHIRFSENTPNGNPKLKLQEKRVIDSGYSRHMTRDMSYLSEYEDIEGGYVAFRGDPKRGKITGKGKINTGSGPTCLFDIDTLTKSMNYKPVVAGNQSNSSAGLQVTQKEDGIFIRKDKYVDEILKKFGFSTMKTASTHIETLKPLMKDDNAEDDSLFDLEAYTDSDYAGASLDKKSIKGDCHFLGRRLISWQCKKQTVVSNSNTEVDRLLEKPTESEGFEQIIDFLNANPIKYALTVNPAIYTSCIKQFWATAKVNTFNGEEHIQALVDKKKLTLIGAKTTAWNEFSITMAFAIICLATNQKFNFSKYIIDNIVKNLEEEIEDKESTEKDTELSHTSVPTEVVADKAVYAKMYDSVERVATTATGLDVEQDRGIINKTQFTTSLNEPSSIGTSFGSGPRCQKTMGDVAVQIRSERVSKLSNDLPLSRVDTHGIGKDRLKLTEFMELCTQLQSRDKD